MASVAREARELPDTFRAACGFLVAYVSGAVAVVTCVALLHFLSLFFFRACEGCSSFRRLVCTVGGLELLTMRLDIPVSELELMTIGRAAARRLGTVGVASSSRRYISSSRSRNHCAPLASVSSRSSTIAPSASSSCPRSLSVSESFDTTIKGRTLPNGPSHLVLRLVGGTSISSNMFTPVRGTAVSNICPLSQESYSSTTSPSSSHEMAVIFSAI
jgi:hypothetical protein